MNPGTEQSAASPPPPVSIRRLPQLLPSRAVSRQPPPRPALQKSHRAEGPLAALLAPDQEAAETPAQRQPQLGARRADLAGGFKSFLELGPWVVFLWRGPSKKRAGFILGFFWSWYPGVNLPTAGFCSPAWIPIMEVSRTVGTPTGWWGFAFFLENPPKNGGCPYGRIVSTAWC